MSFKFCAGNLAALGAAAFLSSNVLADATGDTGGSQSHSNMAPSLAINFLVEMDGAFPTTDTDPGAGNYVGEIIMFAGNFAPESFAEANGQALSKTTNPTLFNAIGTTYGSTDSTFN